MKEVCKGLTNATFFFFKSWYLLRVSVVVRAGVICSLVLNFGSDWPSCQISVHGKEWEMTEV